MWKLWAKWLGVRPRPFEAFGRLSLTQALESFQLITASSESIGSAALFWVSNLFFFIFGAALAFPLLGIRHYALNPFLIFAFTYTFLSVFLLMLLLLNFSAWVSSPTDLEVLLHRPLDSRSYLAVKLLVMLYFTESWGVSYTLPLAFYFVWIRAVPAALLLLLGTVLLTAFVVALVMAAYVGVVKRFGLRRLQTLLNVLQMGAAGVVGLLIILQQRLILQGTQINPDRFLWVPPGWFAAGISFLVLMPNSGRLKLLYVVAALVTVVLTYGVMAGLSRGYVEALVEAQSGGEGPLSRKARRAPRRPLPLNAYIPRRPQRAMFQLVAAYLWRDPKLRLGVLSLAVIFLFYLLLLFSGLTLDPRTNPVDTSVYAAIRDLERFLYLFATYFVFTLTNYFIFHFRFSEHWRAAWIYYVAPAKPVELFTGTLKAITALVIPFAVAVYSVFIVRLSSRWEMVQDLIILILLLLIMEAAWMAVNPGYPLSEAPEQARASLRTSAITFGVPTAAFAVWYVLRQVLQSGSIAVFLVEALVLAAALFGVWRWLGDRVQTVVQDVEV